MCLYHFELLFSAKLCWNSAKIRTPSIPTRGVTSSFYHAHLLWSKSRWMSSMSPSARSTPSEHWSRISRSLAQKPRDFGTSYHATFRAKSRRFGDQRRSTRGDVRRFCTRCFVSIGSTCQDFLQVWRQDENTHAKCTQICFSSEVWLLLQLLHTWFRKFKSELLKIDINFHAHCFSF